MIVQILNRSEVELGIVEAAQDDAKKAEIGTTHDLASVRVTRVVQSDAKENIPERSFIGLPHNERMRLLYIYREAFARVMQERCELAEEERVSALAAVIRCKFCDNTDPRGEQHSHLQHEFTCPHGREIAMPEECVTDHGEVE